MYQISGFRFRLLGIGYHPHTLDPPRRPRLIVRGHDVEGCGGVAAEAEGLGFRVQYLGVFCVVLSVWGSGFEV